MSNPKSKILPRISATFSVVILFYCVDIFYPGFMFDLKTFGVNVLSCICSLITILSFCVARKKTIYEIGFSPLLSDFLKGILSGAVLGVVPIAIVLFLQWILYLITELPAFYTFFITPNGEGDTSLLDILMFAGAGVFYAFSKEIFYRGYIIRSMRPIYPFFDANVVQAAFSVIVPLIVIFRNFFLGHYSIEPMSKRIFFMVATVLFTVIYTFVGSIKRGLIARVQGNIWASVFENFFSLFLGYGLFVGTSMIVSYSAMLKLLLVEGISVMIAIVHYRKQYSRNKKRMERNKEAFLRRRDELLKQEQLRGKDPDLMDINDVSIQDIVDDYNRQMIDNIGKRNKKE